MTEINIKDRGDNTIALDASTARRFDENGFMHVESSHITKEQVAPYRGREIPGWEGRRLDPDRVYFGYRPAEELKKALHTFNGLPIMLMHHTVSADDPKKEYQVGSMATNAVWNAPYVDNGMIFTDSVGIEAVKNGTCREISWAYQYDPDFTPGVFNGVPYDFVMRNLRGNHVAIVEEGRAGPDVVVADSSENLPKGVNEFMSVLKNFFRGANDADPGIEKTELDTAEGVSDIPENGGGIAAADGDKEAKIKKLVGMLSGTLSPDDLKKFENILTDLAYSAAPGDNGLPEKTDVEDDEIGPAKKEEDFSWLTQTADEWLSTPPPDDAEDDDDELDIDEASKNGEIEGKDEELGAAAAKKLERAKLLREQLNQRANDAIKKCGMDSEPDTVKAAFAKGYTYGVHDGEKDMRNPAERKKLDREHEKEGVEKRFATDSAALVRKVERSMSAKYDAAREIAPYVGSVNPMAFDSADSIYVCALSEMGLRAKKESARDVFRAVIATRRQTMANDAAPAPSVRFSGAFSGLNNLEIER